MKIGPCLALLLCLFFFTPLLAAAEEISVKAEIDKGTLTVGERVEYRVSITHDPSLQIVTEIVPPPSDAFAIKEVHDFSEKQGRLIVQGRRFVLTLYELGDFILDPVTIRYRTPQGEQKSVQTNRLYLTVRSVDASGKPKTDIRDVKGTLGLRREWAWLGWLFALIFIAGGGVFLWFRGQKKTKSASPEVPLLSPEDEAFLRLNKLFDSDLIQKGRVKEYFLELSEILRHYFERRFEILAVESTTAEILQDLRKKGVALSLIEKIQQTLELSDLAKFAKWRPSAAEITHINRLSKALVEEARPQSPSSASAPERLSHAV